MPRSAYKLFRPFVVSFSGGRTSAYMLRRILDAHGGWPRDAFCLFANTGKELDETLDFVREIETRWAVPVRWLEYVDGGGTSDEPVTWREVDYATAHRNGMPGSPFDRLLENMPCLPNPRGRRCTGVLKMRVMRLFLESQGWDADFHRFHAIGIRADEADRCVQIKADCPQYVTPRFPLVDDRATVKDVMRFWGKQEFDLKLDQHQGNCDLCFLKSRAKILRLMKDRPELAGWWVERERRKESTATTGSKFRQDRTYAALLRDATQRGLFDGIEDDEVPCGCGAGVGDWCES